MDSRSSHLFHDVHIFPDSVTRILYGAEKGTNKKSFYACSDKDMLGNVVPVRGRQRPIRMKKNNTSSFFWNLADMLCDCFADVQF
jgi:hypothetical protein